MQHRERVKQLLVEKLREDDGFLAIELLFVFSRFEYALKRARYIDGDDHNVRIEWDRFAKENEERFNEIDSEELRRAIDFLKKEPPRKQIVIVSNSKKKKKKKKLKWVKEEPEEDITLKWLLRMVRHVRNSLFHGERFRELLVSSTPRNIALVEHSLTILYACLDLNETVFNHFRKEERLELPLTADES